MTCGDVPLIGAAAHLGMWCAPQLADLRFSAGSRSFRQAHRGDGRALDAEATATAGPREAADRTGESWLGMLRPEVAVDFASRELPDKLENERRRAETADLALWKRPARVGSGSWLWSPGEALAGGSGARVLFENSTVCSKVSAKFVILGSFFLGMGWVPLVGRGSALTGVVMCSAGFWFF